MNDDKSKRAEIIDAGVGQAFSTLFVNQTAQMFSGASETAACEHMRTATRHMFMLRKAALEESDELEA